MYGKELILDLHECNSKMFTRVCIGDYFDHLCELIDMKQCDRHWWDDLDTPEEDKQTSPHTTGTSAIQFILTSNITIHTLDILENVYVNIFSCKDFDSKIAEDFTKKFFKGKVVQCLFIVRK